MRCSGIISDPDNRFRAKCIFHVRVYDLGARLNSGQKCAFLRRALRIPPNSLELNGAHLEYTVTRKVLHTLWYEYCDRESLDSAKDMEIYMAINGRV